MSVEALLWREVHTTDHMSMPKHALDLVTCGNKDRTLAAEHSNQTMTLCVSSLLPEVVSKHLKLLSQNPQTMMTLQLGSVVKQAPGLLTLSSRGSPNRTLNPAAVRCEGLTSPWKDTYVGMYELTYLSVWLYSNSWHKVLSRGYTNTQEKYQATSSG